MQNDKAAIQDEYADDFAWCYGCGKLNEASLGFRTYWEEDGERTITYYTPKKEHMAIPGFVYGGLIASLIDCHGTGSASIALHRKNGYYPGSGKEPPRFVTASLKVDYVRPTPLGVELRAVGSVKEIHPKRFIVSVDVFAGDAACAHGEVECVIMPKSFTK